MGNYKSPEDQKEYNKKYREQNKATIAAKLKQKEECQHCGRCVSHQNMQSHMKSIYCTNRRSNPSNFAYYPTIPIYDPSKYKLFTNIVTNTKGKIVKMNYELVEQDANLD